jgi:hypothetical protein
MNQEKNLKIVSFGIIVITIIIFILFVFRKIDHLFFWVYIAIVALVAFKVVPFLKNKIKKSNK